MNCRHCLNKLKHILVDLGFSPPSNAYLSLEGLKRPEITYPLRVFICENCWLVQTEDYARADELFHPEYSYFSSTSTSWLDHTKQYFAMIREMLKLDENSYVIEVGSNDGYLLKNFVKMGIPCLGIEPTDITANVAEQLGIPVLRDFFGEEMGNHLVAEDKQADLIIANNVYAHVPDINGFTRGLKVLLKPRGTITLEFTSLIRLIDQCLFDIIYHEHYSYLALSTVIQIFEQSGLRVFHVENFPVQGGSLRIFACHTDDPRPTGSIVNEQLEKEEKFGLRDLKIYRDFQTRSDQIKNDFKFFLIEQKRNGKLVGAYGAAAKGNTLLNYSGVKLDLLPWVCDAAPSKQGKFLPGSHIPIVPPSVIKENKPDFILISPWNIAEEIINDLDYVRDWEGKFVRAIPKLEIF